MKYIGVLLAAVSALVAASTVGALETTTAVVAAASTEKRCFPKDFLFGSATASYQVEGAWNEGGRTRSIWDDFCRERQGVDCSNVADDFYHRYRDDIKLMAASGLDSFRFSISWSRVMNWDPATKKMKPNAPGIAFYHDVLDELARSGITPILTLYHWDLPHELHTQLKPQGWLNREIIDHYMEYAELVFAEFGSKVDILSLGWGRDHGVDEVRAPEGARLSSTDDLGQLICTWFTGYAPGYLEFIKWAHKHDPKADILLTENGWCGNDSIDNPDQLWYFQAYLEQRDHGVDEVRAPEGARLSSTNDLGQHNCAWFTGYAPGYLAYIQWAHKHDPKADILLTENGWCGNDSIDNPDQLWYFQAYLEQFKIPVIGYTAWSFYDNYEWGSFKPRFGLYYVNFTAATGAQDERRQTGTAAESTPLVQRA
ncbi:hypothetical protein PybrP1_004225 [[Pythium] brassicae (nom. inval.)]|nr:hypothetical protein PybrP1_004225 [[Pythium] brassicae (nom. inval.)]